MIQISIPGRGDVRLKYLTLDLNGTLALDGRLIEGVVERLQAVRAHLEPYLLTADTFGAMAEVEHKLGFPATRILGSADKTAFVEQLGALNVVAIGNGANDAGMLAAAALGIVVLGPEGLAREALEVADIITPDINVALDLLLNPKRLVATLRR
jgi:P-type E1-E2 ATPase